jgi:glucose/arabinose dehydrogenase
LPLEQAVTKTEKNIMKFIIDHARGAKASALPPGFRPARNWGAVVCLALLSAAALSAQTADTAPAPAPPKKTAKTTKAAETKKATTSIAQPLTIPSDAVAKPDGSYSYTDKSGKKWIYNKTPFGVSKMQDVGEGAADPFVTTPKEQLIKTTDAGDTVKFERQTPFGVTKWEKKKSDMTDEERHIFESQQKPPAAQPE